MIRSRFVVAGLVSAIALAVAATPSAGSTPLPTAAAARSASVAIAGQTVAGNTVPGNTVPGNTVRPVGTIPASCRYPSSRQPTITFSASPTSVRGSASFSLGGTLKLNACEMVGWPVYLYTNNAPTGTFSLVAVTATSTSGGFAFSGLKISRTTYFIAYAPSANGLNATQSAVVQVSWSK